MKKSKEKCLIIVSFKKEGARTFGPFKNVDKAGAFAVKHITKRTDVFDWVIRYLEPKRELKGNKK